MNERIVKVKTCNVDDNLQSRVCLIFQYKNQVYQTINVKTAIVSGHRTNKSQLSFTIFARNKILYQKMHNLILNINYCSTSS